LFAIVNPGITDGELRSLADGGVHGVRFSLAGSGASPPISPQTFGIADPAFGVRRLIDKGRTWVKLSVTYDSSKADPPTYADVNKVGAAYVQAAPERLVCGSNSPHPNETAKPDDAARFNLLAVWAPSEAVRHRILVENPEALYGFARAA
jgi:D-galactarolactone isomerase